MSRRWFRRAAFVVAGIAVGFVAAANLLALLDFRHQHNELASAQQNVSSARLDADRTRNLLAETRAAVAQRTAERDQAETSAALTGDTLFRTQLDASTAQGTAFTQQNQIDALNTCIGGVWFARVAGQRQPGERDHDAAEHLGRLQLGRWRHRRHAPGIRLRLRRSLRASGRGTYYGYSTNAGAGDIQVAKSTDLRNWVFVGNGLAGLPRWTAPYGTWAPSVLPRLTPAGTIYVAYYAAQNGRDGPQCITRAVATSPEGLFVDETPHPMICPRRGDAIDPSPFVDSDGTAYLMWRGANGISSQRLAPDGFSLEGDEHKLADVDQPWEGKVVEGPSMVRAGDRYYLFYSGNNWSSRSYAVGFALCRTPIGPCAKPSPAVAFGASGTIAGPGGQEFFTDSSGQLWMAYHAYTEPNVGYPNSRRLHLMRVAFDPAGAPALNPSG